MINFLQNYPEIEKYALNYVKKNKELNPSHEITNMYEDNSIEIKMSILYRMSNPS